MPFLKTDDTVFCPYNRSHEVLRSKLLTHLSKCRRQHPDVDLVICPFNASHHVASSEIQQHKEKCPDRATVEAYKYQLRPPSGSVEEVLLLRDRLDAEDEERKRNVRRVHEGESWETDEPRAR